MEVIIALALMGLVATNVSVDTKAPQEIKSVSTSIDANKAVKPNVKPKKKKAVKKVNVDPAKQQPAKELAKKETVKSEPAKPEPTPTVSLPEQKSNQSNLFYYILGFLTLGATAAYFYFRKKSQTTDAKIYTSDELKQSLQQDLDKFKSQPPISSAESQSQSSSDPKPDDESKKS